MTECAYVQRAHQLSFTLAGWRSDGTWYSNGFHCKTHLEPDRKETGSRYSNTQLQQVSRVRVTVLCHCNQSRE